MRGHFKQPASLTSAAIFLRDVEIQAYDERFGPIRKGPDPLDTLNLIGSSACSDTEASHKSKTIDDSDAFAGQINFSGENAQVAAQRALQKITTISDTISSILRGEPLCLRLSNRLPEDPS